MKKFILLFIIGIVSLFSSAQQPANNRPQIPNSALQQYSVSGTILDKETSQPLEYATIILIPNNGKAITGGITDKNGKFEIDVNKGTYDISIEFISFNTKTFKNREIHENIDLGIIYLEINAEALNEV